MPQRFCLFLYPKQNLQDQYNVLLNSFRYHRPQLSYNNFRQMLFPNTNYKINLHGAEGGNLSLSIALFTGENSFQTVFITALTGVPSSRKSVYLVWALSRTPLYARPVPQVKRIVGGRCFSVSTNASFSILSVNSRTSFFSSYPSKKKFHLQPVRFSGSEL